jgi:meso-butanediol dehydrogenase/(S,S)-butanediol dehydrogenase/diacetyl reductase
MNRLAGKVALITGGGSGIGAATARLMCSEGAKVMLVDANPEGLANTHKAIAEGVPAASIVAFQADVSDATKAIGSVDETLRAFTRLDILVNNASMRNYSAIGDAKPEEWQAMARVNLMGTANYCRAALPILRKTKGASIVNVSSVHAVAGRKGMGLYDATKAGMLAMTRTLACEEAEYGVRINAVCPGSTLTNFHIKRAEAAGKTVEQLKTERQTTSLLGRWGTPEEIAWPIIWLASDEASFITGATLMVDGGLSVI